MHPNDLNKRLVSRPDDLLQERVDGKLNEVYPYECHKCGMLLDRGSNDKFCGRCRSQVNQEIDKDMPTINGVLLDFPGAEMTHAVRSGGMRPGFILQIKAGDVRAIAQALNKKLSKYRFVPYEYEKEILIRSIREFAESVTEGIDFKAAANELIRLSTLTAKQSDGDWHFGYRIFLRAVAQGQPTTHLRNLAGEKGKGAKQAMQDVIDVAGGMSAKKAPGVVREAVEITTKDVSRRGNVVGYDDKDRLVVVGPRKAIAGQSTPWRVHIATKEGSYEVMGTSQTFATKEEACKYASTITVRKFSGWESTEKKDDFYAMAKEIHDENKKELGEAYMDRDAKRRYYAGYETAKSDKSKGRKTTILPRDNPHWARGYQDFMGGKSPEVKSPLEFLESHEGFHQGDRVAWTVGDQHVTGVVVDFAWITVRVKLDHDVRHLQTGEIIKGGSIVGVADRNLTRIDEAGMSKGQFWAKKGKTPWGDKSKHVTEANEELYALLIKRVQEEAHRRNWKSLPDGMELAAVRAFYDKEIKSHLGASSGVVGGRVAASKATTFEELEAALKAAQDEQSKRFGKFHEGKVPSDAEWYSPDKGVARIYMKTGKGFEHFELMGNAWTWKHVGSYPLTYPIEGEQIAASKDGVKEIIDQHFRKNESVNEDVQWSPAPPEQMDRAQAVVKVAIAKCLGKVFHYTGGTRRYVCAGVHCYGIQGDSPDYIINMDLMALSGSDRGCNPTNDTAKDIGSKWLLDKDQTITFKGKMAYKLASMYKWKAAKPLKPELISGTAVGTHMAFNVGAAAVGAAPRDPSVTQEAVYARLDKGYLSETTDSGALRRMMDMKAASVGTEEWEMLKKALHDDLRSGMLSKDMEQRIRDVLGAADMKHATRPDFEEVQEVADRLERALYKGKVVPEAGEQE